MSLPITHFEANNCRAQLQDQTLTLGNPLVTRQWRVDEHGLLHAMSFNAGGREWFAGNADLPAPRLSGGEAPEKRAIHLTQLTHQRPWEAKGLAVELICQGTAMTLGYRFEIFPEAAGVAIRMWCRKHQEQGEVEPPAAVADFAAGDLLERFNIAARHMRLTHVTFRDGSDDANELVLEHEYLLQRNEKHLALRGNLFVLQDTLSGDGLIFLKEAPLPYARPIPDDYDSYFFGHQFACAFYGNGIGSDETDAQLGYRHVLLAYRGGSAGRTQALHAYQRALRPYQPGRDGLLLSNTWGDRNQDGRISHDFMLGEVDAAARLGVDVVQIDDGWQSGTTSNSVTAATTGGRWEGFWSRANFWSVHPARFPQGLQQLVDKARQHGMKFGLWFAPDSADDLANWKRDAEVLLTFHRECGINYFKIDSLRIRTKKGERNLANLVETLLDESSGRIALDLDITAGIRPGYWGLPYLGPLFVENRYTDRHGYWPHQTLRNLWKLSQFVDPLRLRMEFLNPSRNTDQYANDPLAPACYSPAYLFATVMSCSPLGWFEVSHLPESFSADVAALISIWKQHRAAYHGGRIIPIGNAPDGTSWTGFVSLTADGVYLLVFREFNQQADFTFDLPFLEGGEFAVNRLAGVGEAQISNGRLHVHIPMPQQFFFGWAGKVERTHKAPNSAKG